MGAAPELGNFRIYGVALVLNVSLIFTYNFGMIFPNTAVIGMREFLDHSNDSSGIEESSSEEGGFWVKWSVFVNIAQATSIPACFLSPLLADRLLGRRNSLLAVAGGSFFGFVLTALSFYSPVPWVSLWLGRALSSLCGHLASILTTIFLIEICSNDLRGRVGSLQAVSMSMSSLMAVWGGTPEVLGGEDTWPWAFAALALFCVPAVAICFCIHETPSFLLISQRMEGVIPALESLLFYRNSTLDFLDVRSEAGNIQSESKNGFKILDLFRKKSLLSKTVLVICVEVALLPEMFLNFFSTIALIQIGMSPEWSTKFVVLIEIGGLLLSLASFWFADRFGRRQLFLLSSWGGFVCLSMLCLLQFLISGNTSITLMSNWAVWLFLATLVLLQIFVNLGVRFLVWVIPAELYPTEYRATGEGLGLLLDGVLTVFLFPIPLLLAQDEAAVAYLLLAVPVLAATLYATAYLPETKDKPLALLSDDFDQKRAYQTESD